MVNIKYFIRSLKLTWILRIHINDDAPWINLAFLNIGCKNNYFSWDHNGLIDVQTLYK